MHILIVWPGPVTTKKKQEKRIPGTMVRWVGTVIMFLQLRSPTCLPGRFLARWKFLGAIVVPCDTSSVNCTTACQRATNNRVSKSKKPEARMQ